MDSAPAAKFKTDRHRVAVRNQRRRLGRSSQLLWLTGEVDYVVRLVVG